MILEADEFKGPYHIIKNEFRPFRILVGDFDIYVSQKQNAYLYFSNMKDGVIACKLSDDYLDVVGDYKRYYENLDLPFSQEGIAIFEYRNELFIITSGMTGYIPNQSRIARLSSPLGELEDLGDLCVSNETSTTFHSQISSVFKDQKNRNIHRSCQSLNTEINLTPKEKQKNDPGLCINQ